MRSSVYRDQTLLWLVAGLAASIPLYLVRFVIGPVPTTLWEVGLWLVFFYALLTKQLRGALWQTDPFRWPLTLVVLGGTIALVISPDLVRALGQWKAIIVDALIFYWLLRSIARTPTDLWRILAAALVGGVAVAIHAIGQSLLGATTPDGRVLGIYAQDAGASPNYLALYLAPLAALAVGTAISLREINVKIVSTLAFLVLLGGVWVSGSRGGLLAVAAAVLIGGLVWFRERFPAQRTLVGLVTVLMVLVVGWQVGPSFLPDFSATESTGGRLVSSNNIRFEIWRTTVDTIIPQASIFGIGWAAYQPLFSELTHDRINYPEYIAPLALHPHNFWLMTWLTLGLVGFVGWLWLAGTLLRQAWLVAALPVWLATSAWFVQGLVDTTFYKNDLAAVWMLLLAGFALFVEQQRVSSNPHL